MQSNSMFVPELHIPSSYKQICESIRKYVKSEYIPKCIELHKTSPENADLPSIHLNVKVLDEHVTDNIVFLKQAETFEELAKKSSMESKPILFHYAEEHLFMFFINTVFDFDGYGGGHGMVIKNKTKYDLVGIKINQNGFFQKIMNTYSCLSDYTPAVFSVCDSFHMKTKTSLLLLSDIVNKRKSNFADVNMPGARRDRIDFLLIFIASSLARYSPSIWNEVASGRQDDSILYIEKAFDRFDLLKTRLYYALYELYSKNKCSVLSGSDMMYSDMNNSNPLHEIDPKYA